MRFVVLSPDGLPIEPRSFPSREVAQKALQRWCRRFTAQGYYAAVGGHIPLDQLPARCQVLTEVRP
jgi:hypothetical protein